MSIKRGDVISHSKAGEWGVGKVVDVTPYRVTIHFNDGITRKIVSSYFECLLPAQANLYFPVPEVVVQKVVIKTSPKARKKVKQ